MNMPAKKAPIIGKPPLAQEVDRRLGDKFKEGITSLGFNIVSRDQRFFLDVKDVFRAYTEDGYAYLIDYNGHEYLMAGSLVRIVKAFPCFKKFGSKHILRPTSIAELKREPNTTAYHKDNFLLLRKQDGTIDRENKIKIPKNIRVECVQQIEINDNLRHKQSKNTVIV